jgi:hypothetical protein
VVAEQRHAAQPAVGGRDLLRVEPGTGLALEIGVDRARLADIDGARLRQRAVELGLEIGRQQTVGAQHARSRRDQHLGEDGWHHHE